jgi:two-component system KDP operon response regulator KdpE
MNAPRLLLVDDEAQLVRVLRPSLEAAGYTVETAADGNAALQCAETKTFDVIILDLGLPDLDGKAVIAAVRRRSDTPIIVLSARDTEEEKIEALDVGANDFVNKPFKMGELLARLRAATRARRDTEAAEIFEMGYLRVDFASRRASINGRDVKPSPRELRLLRAFIDRLGDILTYKQIAAVVWGEDARVEAQFVRVLVGNLRQKIELDPGSPQLILTEPGIGYRMRKISA